MIVLWHAFSSHSISYYFGRTAETRVTITKKVDIYFLKTLLFCSRGTLDPHFFALILSFLILPYSGAFAMYLVIEA